MLSYAKEEGKGKEKCVLYQEEEGGTLSLPFSQYYEKSSLEREGGWSSEMWE